MCCWLVVSGSRDTGPKPDRRIGNHDTEADDVNNDADADDDDLVGRKPGRAEVSDQTRRRSQRGQFGDDDDDDNLERGKKGGAKRRNPSDDARYSRSCHDHLSFVVDMSALEIIHINCRDARIATQNILR